MNLSLARGLRERFQIEFLIARDNGHHRAITVSARHQRFEYLFRRKPDLRRHGLGGQIVRIDFVFAQFVADAELVEQSGGIGFGGQGAQGLKSVSLNRDQ